MDGFAAVAEPTRRRILDQLRLSDAPDRRPTAQGGMDVGALVSATGLPQPTVSKHLRVLRESGAVTVRVQGPRRVYRIAPRPLADVTAWLEPYRRMWADSLDALERHLDDIDQTGGTSDE